MGVFEFGIFRVPVRNGGGGDMAEFPREGFPGLGGRGGGPGANHAFTVRATGGVAGQRRRLRPPQPRRGTGVALSARYLMLASLFGVLTLPSAAAGQTCLACHGSHEFMAGITGDSTRAERLTVDPQEFRATVHGAIGFACELCHTGMGDFPHAASPRVDCGACHHREEQQLAQSVHGRPHPLTDEEPAACADCHSDHHIRRPTDPRSTVYRLTLFETCAVCHEDADRMRRFGQENVQTVATYLNSVHGRALLAKGLSVAPVCTDCHGEGGSGAHEIQEVAAATCPMNRERVVETCGRCHAGITAQYDRGIHGEQFREGNPDAPTCISCHAEHGVQPIASAESGVNPRHISRTCTACHDQEEFNAKYGLNVARGRTFDRSFHGIALRSGQLTVANCESCHGAHEILPSSNPSSPIHASNLMATCGSCHPGIGKGVAQGRIHVASFEEEQSLVGAAVRWFYILVIGVTVLYAFGLIALDQYRYRVVDPQRGRGSHA